MRAPTPKSVILDLMSSAGGKDLAAGWLTKIGGHFGFTENTMRVTLSRLTNCGLIESSGRGFYRMTHNADAVNDFVAQWRLGERRVVHWRQLGWLVAHVESSASDWVLHTLGFRQVRKGLFARPDNLAFEAAAVTSLAHQLGMSTDVLVMSAKIINQIEFPGWAKFWDPETLNNSYRSGLLRLQTSANSLPGLKPEQALVETFNLGGEIVHLLAKDPLLPRSMVDVSARQDLWQEMLNYERIGKKYWAQAQDENLTAQVMPTAGLAAGG